VRRRLGPLAGAAAGALALAALAPAATVQKDDLRLTVLGQIKPFKLPRTGTAPIAVFVAGHIDSSRGGVPPQLRRMEILVNRHGLLRDTGLPVCDLSRIKSVSSGRALASCGPALVGSGRFWASIVLPSQRPYRTRGRLLIFNGRLGRTRALFAHIFTTNPFASSFVIPFRIKRIRQGPYGTQLAASLPETLGEWGYVDRIKLTLRRKYRYRGRQLSYFNAGCPALQGTNSAVFPLARVNFSFATQDIAVSVPKTCGVAR